MKRHVLAALTHRRVSPLWRPLTRGCSTIFMLHRFADRPGDVAGHDAETMRRHLAYLRRERVRIVRLDELLAHLRSGSPDERMVAFTVDDGYADFKHIGAPIFSEFDCPVTVFLTSGFIDGALWMWWDRIEFAFLHSRRHSASVELSGERYEWINDEGRDRISSAVGFAERVKILPTAERLAAIANLELALDVELPVRPPDAYSAMTWDDVRACARRGTTFGPHTVSHPVLARASATECEYEMRTSWERVRHETDAAIPIFCYPNGAVGDFGQRERALLQHLGIEAAVTAIQDYATPAVFAPADPFARYAVPRFALPHDDPHFAKIVSGLERATLHVRRALTRSRSVQPRPAPK